MPFLGEAASLGAALIWALASIIYARLGKTIDPMGLNFAKGVIAIAFLFCTPTLWQQDWSALSLSPVGLLFLSGLIGVGFGDTLYFEALKRLGPRKTLLLGVLAPPMTAALAIYWLQETLVWMAYVGIVITLGGISWVILERSPQSQASSQMPSDQIWLGISFAVGAAATNAIGALLSRTALADSLLRPEVAALIRIVAGVLLLIIWGSIRQRLGNWCRRIVRHPEFKCLVLAAFGGTYLGIWLQQVGLKFSSAGIAQTLISTSPVFILPVAVWMGENVSLRSWLGAIIAVLGVSILFLFH